MDLEVRDGRSRCNSQLNGYSFGCNDDILLFPSHSLHCLAYPLNAIEIIMIELMLNTVF